MAQLPDSDDWGKDPSVRRMREVFSRMEHALNNILEKIDISPYDARIRTVKENALNIFERVYPVLASNISHFNDDTLIMIYIQCLKKALLLTDIQLNADIFPENKEIDSMIMEIFQS